MEINRKVFLFSPYYICIFIYGLFLTKFITQMNMIRKFILNQNKIHTYSNTFLFSYLHKNQIIKIIRAPIPTQHMLTYQHRYYFSEDGQKNKKLTKQQRANFDQAFKKKTQQMMQQLPQDEQDMVSYKKSDSKLGKYLIGVSVLALLIVYAMMEIQSIRAQKKIDKSVTGLTKVSSKGKANIGGQWTLLDTKGKPFGSKDLQGTYYLIYFGFTNCPDICPNSLLKLTKALNKIKKMPQYQYMSIKTIFVSVDPDRDTPQKIQKFLSYFDKSFIGVSGKSNDDQNLRQCMKKFKIYASKIEFEDEDTQKLGRKSYTIDHTILTYLMSDSNQYLTHLGGNLGQHELAKQILQKIIANQHTKMQLLRAS